jgi:uncharacterized protein
MAAGERVIADTNVLVSRFILPESISAKAIRLVELDSTLLFSDATMMELADVMARSRFNRYLSRENRERFVLELCSIVEFVPIIQTVRECRDPDDDRILEVALNGRADIIITGDEDLLALSPWPGIAILTPAQYLSQQSDQEI